MTNDQLLQQFSKWNLEAGAKLSSISNDMASLKRNQQDLMEAILGNEKYQRVGLIENDKRQNARLDVIEDEIEELGRIKKTIRTTVKFAAGSGAAALAAASAYIKSKFGL